MSNLEYKSIEDAYNKGIACCKEIESEDDMSVPYEKRKILSYSEKKRVMSIAVEYFNVAANERHALAQYYLGLIYQQDKYQGCGVKRDQVKAAHYFKLAAEQGVADAQVEYSQALFHGDGVKENLDEYIYWLAKAAENGSPKGMLYFAEQLIGIRGDEKLASYDYNRAVYYLRKASVGSGLWQGMAQGLMGVAYVEGWGVIPDNKSALSFFSKALKNRGSSLWSYAVFYVYKYMTTGLFPSFDKLNQYEDYDEIVENRRLKDKIVEELQLRGI